MHRLDTIALLHSCFLFSSLSRALDHIPNAFALAQACHKTDLHLTGVLGVHSVCVCGVWFVCVVCVRWFVGVVCKSLLCHLSDDRACGVFFAYCEFFFFSCFLSFPKKHFHFSSFFVFSSNFRERFFVNHIFCDSHVSLFLFRNHFFFMIFFVIFCDFHVS